ncbi:hypothetical protein LTR85_002854 [Meristemomyces frigidus]|nr:hypothetical protein LTR85_002854 [Meristemomyces frigidus]
MASSSIQTMGEHQAIAPAYKYPELLNVYLAPTAQTITVGITRLATIVIFGLGTFIYAPAIFLDDEAPNWLVPAAIVGSAVPFLTAVAFGPTITSIRAFLPNSARRSKESLLAFANNTPPNTRLRLQFIRWAPWLTTRDMLFSDFRRLPKSRLRLSNLENTATNEMQAEVLKKYGWLGRAIHKYPNRYWVNVTDTKKDRSHVPGVWERMWKQIPMAGDEVVIAAKGERKPVGLQNRPQLGQQVGPPRFAKAVRR